MAMKKAGKCVHLHKAKKNDNETAKDATLTFPEGTSQKVDDGWPESEEKYSEMCN